MNKLLSLKQRRCLRLIVGFTLTALLLVSGAQAQVDSDNDGLSDALEDSGFVATDGQNFSRCPAGALPTDPCVHPNAPDVFVILIPASAGSLLPANPLAFVVNLAPSLGVHQMSNNPASADNQARLITLASTQKAIRITEDLNTTDTPWGRSLFHGTPNSGGEATVFTQRIKKLLDEKYVGATGSPAPVDVVNNCVRHVIAHEAGHSELIKKDAVSRNGGHHYSTSDKVVMSQSATISVKGSRVTVTCPDTYASPDTVDFRLK